MSQLQSKKVYQNPNFQAQHYPTDTIIRVDDPYSFKSGYIQLHNLDFELSQMTYGNNEIRRHYNITKDLKRYFAKRYFFFSLFDQGIELDEQSWYSVVAEPISIYLCERFKMCGVKSVFEPFCGVGGIAVHFAGNFQTLVVNDICEKKIKMLKNNLSVYSKGLNLLTIHNKDYAEIKVFPVDVVLICPPWGGMDVGQYCYRDLDEIMKPKLSDILNHCKKFSRNIMLQMPKTTNIQSLLKIINLCFLSPIIKIEKINVDGRLSQIFVYIGDTKFTAFNCHIFSEILKASGKEIKNIKEMKKDLKKKLKQQKFEIFEQIYQHENVKTNKHVFFTDLQNQ